MSETSVPSVAGPLGSSLSETIALGATVGRMSTVPSSSCEDPSLALEDVEPPPPPRTVGSIVLVPPTPKHVRIQASEDEKIAADPIMASTCYDEGPLRTDLPVILLVGLAFESTHPTILSDSQGAPLRAVFAELQTRNFVSLTNNGRMTPSVDIHGQPVMRVEWPSVHYALKLWDKLRIEVRARGGPHFSEPVLTTTVIKMWRVVERLRDRRSKTVVHCRFRVPMGVLILSLMPFDFPKHNTNSSPTNLHLQPRDSPPIIQPEDLPGLTSCAGYWRGLLQVVKRSRKRNVDRESVFSPSASAQPNPLSLH